MNKVFLYNTTAASTRDGPLEEVPVEITSLSPPDDEIRDVQGSFESFAVFTALGQVLIADRAFLDAVNAHQINGPSAEVPLPQPTIIPALQNKNVVSLAFGDYHFHALHSNGSITSWGREPRSCGALGLGTRELALLRGLRPDGPFAVDSRLEADKIRLGRSVWFEKEKRLWLQDMVAKSRDSEAAERWQMMSQGIDDAHIVMGEWFERQGRAWADGVPSYSSSPETPAMGAYFALKVSAAGWHSGALVLVDEEKAARIEQLHIVKPPAVQAAELEREIESEQEDEHDGPGSDEEDGPNGPNSPFQQLEIGIAWSWAYVVWVCRWFLGLKARDEGTAAAAAAATPTAEQGTGLGYGGNVEAEEIVYTWRDQPFPRLRLPNGEEMPGSVPLTEWRGGEPEWGT